MPIYLTHSLQETDINNDQRIVWVTTNAQCGYWTDDWSKLLVKGSPQKQYVCPHCRSVGTVLTMRRFLDSALLFEIDRRMPHYVKFLLHYKEQCLKRYETTFIHRYNEWVVSETHKNLGFNKG